MTRREAAAGAAVLLLALAACGGPPATGAAAPASSPPAAAPPAPPTSVRDGVYSSAQADRGAVAYAQECASCHADDLRGSGNAPSLVGVGFLFFWEGQSLGELYTSIRTEMPTNAPNSLPATTYLDIVAHVLRANEFPAGGVDLPADAVVLDGITIETSGAPGG